MVCRLIGCRPSVTQSSWYDVEVENQLRSLSRRDQGGVEGSGEEGGEEGGGEERVHHHHRRLNR